MLKLSKKADYGLIALRHLATCDCHESCSAADIAKEYGISAALMAKILQRLAKQGLVAARHGATGGYRLARDPSVITALDVIHAVDGPQRVTSCVTSHGECRQTSTCTVREPLRKVSESILELLNRLTISQMAAESAGGRIVELQR